ncbi:MAG TPA: sodium:solute symporter family protein [Planctomycetaceae bacterium]
MTDAARESLQPILAATIVVYMAAMYAIGVWAKGKVEDEEDYLVAGRRLPFSLSTLTLVATWFGAETLLATPDEVREGGLREIAMDPLGMGLCLMLGGLLLAGPLWRMGLLTLGDFFRVKFGRAAELLSSLILVPSYFGWIAAQFLALAAVMELFFGWDPAWGLAVVAVVGTGYTLLGGMWSVTLTDSVQMVLIFLGLALLGGVVFAELGGGDLATGVARLAEHDPDKLTLVPQESVPEILGWLNVLAIGALGSLPAQDLVQRMFASKSARVAQASCVAGGALYWLAGLMPVTLALAADLAIPGAERASGTLPALAGAFLNPFLASVFVVVILSAVLSTITAAVLAPAGVLAQNVLARPLAGVLAPIALNRLCVVGVAGASLTAAYFGESAAELLQAAYEMTMVSLLVPLLLGLWMRPASGLPALASMAVGIGLWSLHFAGGLMRPEAGWDERFLGPTPLISDWHLPPALAMTACSLVAYLATDAVVRLRSEPQRAATPATEPGISP